MIHARCVSFRSLASFQLIVGALVALVGAAPARGQQCLESKLGSGSIPLPGIENFQANVTVEWSGSQEACGSNVACTSTCTLVSSDLAGDFTMRFCPRWQVPPSGGDGWWCWVAQLRAAAWSGSAVGEGGTVNFGYASSSFGGLFSMQAHSTLRFMSATTLALDPGTSAQVAGGRQLSSLPNRYFFDTGATAAIACGYSGIAAPGGMGYTYQLCPDVDSNGICDEYDAAARAFGDFDSSGSVNGADLAALLAAWGSSGSACDINQDGNVDGTDLAFLLSRWGQGAP